MHVRMNVRMRVLAPITAILMLALAGCSGALGGTSSAASGGLEKTTLNVAVVPAVDSAGFFVALHEGLFKRQGLTINYTPATSSDTVINQQVAGKYDITGGNYVSYIQHYVQDHQQLEIVAEGSVMQQGSQAIYTLPTSKIKNLRQAERYLPDNIYTALEDFRNAEWTTKLLGADVKGRYADLKQAAADRCPRLLGTFVKAPEVQYHHDVYNQYLWNKF